MKEKVLLVIPRYPFDKRVTNKANFRYHFTFGIAYISAVLKKEKYHVDILNLNHYDGKIENLIGKALSKENYNYLATGGNALLYSPLKKIIDCARKFSPSSKIILGGPIITSEPEIAFNLLNPDFGVVGEGEETIIELLQYVNKNRDLKKVNGIVYKQNGKTIMTERRKEVQDLDILPIPDLEGVEFEKVLKRMHTNDFYYTQIVDYPKVYPILGSRGCPFNCTFCYHEGKYRARSLENIMKEIKEAVKKYDVNIINLYDEQFALKKERLLGFCEEIKKLQEELGKKIYWTCQLSVIAVNEELLKTMKEAGCFVVSYGFESFSKDVLKSMKKPITPELIHKAFHATIKQKMAIQAFFIFGDIAETKETSETTLNWWKKNAKGQFGIGFIQPYPGSEIYQHCVKKGIIKDKSDYIKNKISIDHWYNMTENMTDKQIKKLKNKILNYMAKYCKYVIPMKKKRELSGTYKFKVKCPYCKKIQTYKNCSIKNKHSYGFYIICRSCFMRFFIVSFIQKIAYRFYAQTRFLRDLQSKIKDYFTKKKL